MKTASEAEEAARKERTVGDGSVGGEKHRSSAATARDDHRKASVLDEARVSGHSAGAGQMREGIDKTPYADPRVGTTQVPSVGRMVHYRPYRSDGIPPAAAIITFVSEAVRDHGYVNLAVFDYNGKFSGGMVNVPYKDTPDEQNGYWEWPPRV